MSSHADESGQQDAAEALDELNVRCLMMTLHSINMLLPNTLVAEVTELPAVNTASNTPDWLRGFVAWRGRNVPLISFEVLLGRESIGRFDESRMVVINTLNDNLKLPFIATEIQGLPHLSLVTHENVEYDESEVHDEPVVLSSMRVDGESVIVPNIDVIERMLENLGISA